MTKDPRIIKSQRDIQAAFITLLNQKDFTAITIQDICNEALISRSTFYSHYLDKYDLLEQIIDKTLINFEMLFQEKYDVNPSPAYFHTFLEDIYQLYQEQRELLTALIRTPFPEQASFSIRFKGLCRDYAQLLLTGLAQPSYPTELLTNLFTENIFCLMTWTLEHGPSEQVTQLAKDLHRHFLELIDSTK